MSHITRILKYLHRRRHWLLRSRRNGQNDWHLSPDCFQQPHTKHQYIHLCHFLCYPNSNEHVREHGCLDCHFQNSSRKEYTSFTDHFRIAHLTVRFRHGTNNECEAVYAKKHTCKRNVRKPQCEICDLQVIHEGVNEKCS